MLHLLRKLWRKAAARRAEPTSGPARRGRLNVEPLETRSMLSAMPLHLDGSYDFVVGREVDEPTVSPERQSVIIINRPAANLPFEFGMILGNPAQTESVIPLWPLVKFPTNPADDDPGSADLGGLISNSSSISLNSSAAPDTHQEQPAIAGEALQVHDLIANLGFVAEEVKAQPSVETPKFDSVTPALQILTPKAEAAPLKFESVTPKAELATPKNEVVAPKLEKVEPLASPVTREKSASKPESAATSASATSQPLVQFVDDAEGGMVALGYHKVADQSAMLTATSAANVASILDRAVQFDRAYGTFQAFEVSSGEAPVQSLAPAASTTSPAAKPIGTTGEQNQRPNAEQAKPAIGGISFLPALDTLKVDLGAGTPIANLGGASVKLDEACVDAVFSTAATEEQYEQSIGNPSLFQIIAALAVATVLHRSQTVRASEPDKASGALPVRSPAKQ